MAVHKYLYIWIIFFAHVIEQLSSAGKNLSLYITGCTGFVEQTEGQFETRFT